MIRCSVVQPVPLPISSLKFLPSPFSPSLSLSVSLSFSYFSPTIFPRISSEFWKRRAPSSETCSKGIEGLGFRGWGRQLAYEDEDLRGVLVYPSEARMNIVEIESPRAGASRVLNRGKSETQTQTPEPKSRRGAERKRSSSRPTSSSFSSSSSRSIATDKSHV